MIQLEVSQKIGAGPDEGTRTVQPRAVDIEPGFGVLDTALVVAIGMFPYPDSLIPSARAALPEQQDGCQLIEESSRDISHDIQLLVDADACPRGALEVMRRLQREFGYRLVTVASFHHDVGGAGAAEHVTVGDGPDAADWAVVNRTRAGDVVVTQDWGLAALVLAKGAACMSPAGREYTAEVIDFQLDERHVKAKHRRSGGRTKGPRARTVADDERFERTLRRLLRRRP